MKQVLFTVTLIIGFILLSSCSSSEESRANRRDPITTEVTPTPQLVERSDPERPRETSAPAQQTTQSKGAQLKSRQDTLVASITKRASALAHSARSINRPDNPAYTVQVGAFTKAHNALRYQKLVKKRFSKNSAHNVYDSESKLYRVSIGKFSTLKEAAALRHEIIKKYPKEYSEAWVNYLPK